MAKLVDNLTDDAVYEDLFATCKNRTEVGELGKTYQTERSSQSHAERTRFTPHGQPVNFSACRW
jgi:hypothetical protein